MSAEGARVVENSIRATHGKMGAYFLVKYQVSRRTRRRQLEEEHDESLGPVQQSPPVSGSRGSEGLLIPVNNKRTFSILEII